MGTYFGLNFLIHIQGHIAFCFIHMKLNLVHVNHGIKEMHVTTLKNNDFQNKITPKRKWHHIHDWCNVILCITLHQKYGHNFRCLFIFNTLIRKIIRKKSQEIFTQKFVIIIVTAHFFLEQAVFSANHHHASHSFCSVLCWIKLA